LFGAAERDAEGPTTVVIVITPEPSIEVVIMLVKPCVPASVSCAAALVMVGFDVGCPVLPGIELEGAVVNVLDREVDVEVAIEEELVWVSFGSVTSSEVEDSELEVVSGAPGVNEGKVVGEKMGRERMIPVLDVVAMTGGLTLISVDVSGLSSPGNIPIPLGPRMLEMGLS